MSYIRPIAFVAIFTVFAYNNTQGTPQDSIRLNGIDKRLDTFSIHLSNSLKDMKGCITGVECKNDGRFESLSIWIGVAMATIILIVGLNAVNVGRLVRAEARDTIEDRFEIYFKRIEKMTNEATQLLSEIKSYHSVAANLTDKVANAADKISSGYKKEG